MALGNTVIFGSHDRAWASGALVVAIVVPTVVVPVAIAVASAFAVRAALWVVIAAILVTVAILVAAAVVVAHSNAAARGYLFISSPRTPRTSGMCDIIVTSFNRLSFFRLVAFTQTEVIIFRLI